MTILYQLCEIDALDRILVLRRGLRRDEATNNLKKLRGAYSESGLRYIIRRERPLAASQPARR